MGVPTVREYTRHGGTLLAAHRAGGRLTKGQAILAKCWDCCCGFADGRRDCESPRCPLHDWMPYRR